MTVMCPSNGHETQYSFTTLTILNNFQNYFNVKLGTNVGGMLILKHSVYCMYTVSTKNYSPVYVAITLANNIGF